MSDLDAAIDALFEHGRKASSGEMLCLDKFNAKCILSAASPLPSRAWEPIETAPKDKPVLTWRGAGLMAVAERMDHPADFGKKRQREIWCCTDGCELLNVTHWMPLPQSPQEPQ